MDLQMSISSVVLFVDDLDRSVDFYLRFGLEVAIRSEDAALLTNKSGMQIYLRGLARADHPLDQVGAQYVIWTAADRQALVGVEDTLKELDAYTHTWSFEEIVIVEGRDPSRIPFLVTNPGPASAPRQEIIARIYES